MKMHITVEPPVSDHTICQELVFAYGRWSLSSAEASLCCGEAGEKEK